MTTLNGNNVAELNQFIEAVRRDPARRPQPENGDNQTAQMMIANPAWLW